jgi:molybdate transport system ATP-binding protein
MTLSVRLEHAFPGFALDLGFEAPAGVTALFGRSGSGKTSIVNAVAGLLQPDQGRIVLDGQVLYDRAAGTSVPPQSRRIGYVFQEGRLFPHLSVRANLTFGSRFAPPDATGPTLGAVSDLLGLGALLDRRPRHLSGGERQRVALGRALLSRPRLLLMDEPLAALDAGIKADILPYLDRLRRELRLPVLYVSHSVAEIARLADHVVILDGGRVRAAGALAAILADPDLAGALGLREAGAVLTARLAAQDADGLSRLETSAGPVWLPRVPAPVGSDLRLRILAQDVLLARVRPEGLSALNILPATIRTIRTGSGPGALVQLDLNGSPLLARVTRRSAEAMGLQPGQSVFAVLKSVALAPDGIGGVEPGPDEGA